MNDAPPPRLGESLRGLADSGLATLQTRLDLFAVELHEEKIRAAGFLFNTVLAALFIGFGVLLLALMLGLALWDSHRLLGLGLAAVLLLGAGLLAATRAAARLREGSRLFHASLAELQQDRDRLQP